MEQPVEIDGRPVTFWVEMPPQQNGSVEDVAQLLAKLHSLPIPAIDLGYLDAFVRVDERLHAAITIPTTTSSGCTPFTATSWRPGPSGRPVSPIGLCTRRLARQHHPHGRRSPDDGPGALFRRVPEWDLASTAVRAQTTGAISIRVYDRFCAAYGHDVTAWEGYPSSRAPASCAW
ncbi:hypothetical protein RM698_01935 [Streptomyces sp. DSM 41979]|uniref:Aminoglycoside phosphotransferase domain-containing protein n=1 Tax=Streptomyces evansiae TaxID=3075535 RepID=A0ABU2QUU0_9ACTN|nr:MULTISPECIES: hypothetical protein [unclassified Streptomyces]MDT0407812.1 hypothetical protein [Streptomyces sp. DSM 41979]